MEPENHPCEKEKHLPNLQFLGSMSNLGGVYCFFQNLFLNGPIFFLYETSL